MPRNPHKSPCTVSGCRNWAMRGHTHCRSHRDRELGARGGGPPPGNLNALKTGDHAHPLSPADLSQLAAELAREPGSLPAIIDGIVRSIHSRAPDPYSGLAALRVAVTGLRAGVAANLFADESKAWILRLPPEERGQALNALQRRRVRHLSPGAALGWLRTLMIESEKTSEQVPVHTQAPLPGSSAPHDRPRRASPPG